ncbi:hypothetical protein B0H34DRAFT_799620 [Crassisporium funariophilum]|nr:hypothetical protein B0H34DRAFT_799620 [Crassisporium funariophilum]
MPPPPPPMQDLYTTTTTNAVPAAASFRRGAGSDNVAATDASSARDVIFPGEASFHHQGRGDQRTITTPTYANANGLNTTLGPSTFVDGAIWRVKDAVAADAASAWVHAFQHHRGGREGNVDARESLRKDPPLRSTPVQHTTSHQHLIIPPCRCTPMYVPHHPLPLAHLRTLHHDYDDNRRQVLHLSNHQRRYCRHVEHHDHTAALFLSERPARRMASPPGHSEGWSVEASAYPLTRLAHTDSSGAGATASPLGRGNREKEGTGG